jgi:adenylate kinase family enzyme
MLIDGFPRTFGQLYMFIDRMKKAQMEFEVILLDMNIDTAIDRLADRKFYRKDGYIYHIRTTEDLEYANTN